MHESSLWQTLNRNLAGFGWVFRIENSVMRGVPDVHYAITSPTGASATGWIELKVVNKFPTRGGPVRIRHFTDAQRAWLQRYGTAGGNAFLLLQVAIPKTYFLFDFRIAQAVGDLPEAAMRCAATVVGDKIFPQGAMLDALTTKA